MFQRDTQSQVLLEAMKKKDSKRTVVKNAYIECKDLVFKRQDCWNNSTEGKHTEECFVEELAEKRCLTSHLCPDLYRKFYEYTDCHLWAEAFAHKNEEQYIDARAKISRDRVMSSMCRGIVQDLSKAMSKYSKYRSEILEDSPFLEKKET